MTQERTEMTIYTIDLLGRKEKWRIDDCIGKNYDKMILRGNFFNFPDWQTFPFDKDYDTLFSKVKEVTICPTNSSVVQNYVFNSRVKPYTEKIIISLETDQDTTIKLDVSKEMSNCNYELRVKNTKLLNFKIESSVRLILNFDVNPNIEIVPMKK